MVKKGRVMERDYEDYIDDEVSSIRWEETIKLQEMFEDSALQDASAYARMIQKSVDQFKNKGER
jgi:hypothetical protein